MALALIVQTMWQALEHREAALKLAEHWKEEAIKQAKFAQVSNRAAQSVSIQWVWASLAASFCVASPSSKPSVPCALCLEASLEPLWQLRWGAIEKAVSLVQEAGSAQLQKQRKALQEENRRLQQQLLDAQAAVLQQQAAVADLQHLLAMAERRVVTPVKSQVP